jgi:hypothetical protein
VLPARSACAEKRTLHGLALSCHGTDTLQQALLPQALLPLRTMAISHSDLWHVVSLLYVAVIFERATPLPSFNLDVYTDNHVQELVCPPGTFVRSWDGRADANGLYALAISCSDGTYLGDVGSWAQGEPFNALTQSDGYVGVTAVTDSAGSVVGLSFTDRWDDTTPTYGASGTSVVTNCREAQRVVGLAVRATTGRGNIGTFGLLCGDVKGEPRSLRYAADMPHNDRVAPQCCCRGCRNFLVSMACLTVGCLVAQHCVKVVCMAAEECVLQACSCCCCCRRCCCCCCCSLCVGCSTSLLVLTCCLGTCSR